MDLPIFMEEEMRAQRGPVGTVPRHSLAQTSIASLNVRSGADWPGQLQICLSQM